MINQSNSGGSVNPAESVTSTKPVDNKNGADKNGVDKTNKNIDTKTYQIQNNIVNLSSEKARKLIPFDTAVKFDVLPSNLLTIDGIETLTIFVTENADSHSVTRLLRFSTGKEISCLNTKQSTLKESIYRAYKGADNLLIESSENLKNINQHTPQIKLKNIDPRGGEGEISHFINTLLDYAIAKNASDIHIAPGINGTQISLRINGELHFHPNPICEITIHEKLVSRIKVLANLNIAQRVKAQDGSFFIDTYADNQHFRVSILPSIFGEKVVIRLTNTLNILKLKEVEFDSMTANNLNLLLNCQKGLILFCGPTGSGKSSSIYSMIRKIANGSRNIITVEDPVESYIDGVIQTSVDEKNGQDYTTILRSILRQDPDVIFLGEIRGKEEATEAIRASLAGRLVISTFHASTTYEMLIRFLGFGIDLTSLVSSLSLVVHQRLVPKLCNSCKVIDLNTSNIFDFNIFKRAGCANCHQQGIKDRILATGSLLFEQTVREIVYEKLPPVKDFYKRLETNTNYQPIHKTLLELLKEGTISYNDFVSITHDSYE